MQKYNKKEGKARMTKEDLEEASGRGDKEDWIKDEDALTRVMCKDCERNGVDRRTQSRGHNWLKP